MEKKVFWVSASVGANPLVLGQVRIDIDDHSNVDDLRDAIKLKFAPILDNYASAELIVKTVDGRILTAGTLLKELLPTTDATSMIVFAPERKGM